MHTVWVRLNAVVFFGLTVIVSLASLTWVSTIGHSGFPAVDVLRVNSVKTLRSHVRLEGDSGRSPDTAIIRGNTYFLTCRRSTKCMHGCSLPSCAC